MRAKRKCQAFDTFTVVSLVAKFENGVTIAQLKRLLNCSDDALKGQIKRLRKAGKIQRLAYGLWKVTEKKVSNFADNPKGYPNNPILSLHDIWFRLQPLVTKSWHHRRVLYDAKNLAYRPFLHAGQSESFRFMGVTLITTDRKVIVVLSKAYFGVSFGQVSVYALADLKRVVGEFCRFCGVSVPLRLKVDWTDRCHYAKTEDRLAQDYRLRGQKLRVPLSKGSLVIDFSDHVDHLELKNGDPAFMDQGVVPFFRGLERFPAFTPEFQLKMNDGFQKQLAFLTVIVKDLQARVR
jgi:hypothetical protein